MVSKIAEISRRHRQDNVALSTGVDLSKYWGGKPNYCGHIGRW